MIYAYNQNKERIKATETGQRALCPCCNSEVHSYCGKFIVNHWKHKRKVDCDDWYQPMSEWHYNWQQQFPKEWREKVMFDKVTREKHIADIRRPDGKVIEFQHSVINVEEIESRENFYKDMVWVLDGEKLLNKVSVKLDYTPSYYIYYTLNDFIFRDISFYKHLEQSSLIIPFKEIMNKSKNFFLKRSINVVNKNDSHEEFDNLLVRLVFISNNEELYENDIISFLIMWNSFLEKKGIPTRVNHNIADTSKVFIEEYNEYSLDQLSSREFMNFMQKPVFIDNIDNYPSCLWWLQEEKLIKKEFFISKFLNA